MVRLARAGSRLTAFLFEAPDGVYELRKIDFGITFSFTTPVRADYPKRIADQLCKRVEAPCSSWRPGV